MAEIYPFRGLRYTKKAGKLRDCVCPPYDIISDEERKALCDGNVFNLVRLEKPEGDDKYVTARKTLDKWLENGVLKADDEESVYLYREEFTLSGKRYSFDGIVALCRLYDFSENVVLPHEETLSKAKEDRFRLMLATRSSFSSIYSLYSDSDGRISAAVSAARTGDPVSRFTDSEDVTHSLWKVSDPEAVNGICSAFAEKQLFIADGHHRYETALRYRDFTGYPEAESVLMTMVDMDSDGLIVLPTHRVVTESRIGFAELKELLKEDFEVTDGIPPEEAAEVLAARSESHAFVLYGGGDGAVLLVRKPRPVCDSPVKELDVSVLHDDILEKLLGIDKADMAAQKSLRYTRSAEEAISAVRSGNAAYAFIINPTKVREIKAVAAAGEKMPQKSTYFYPKLKTGLVMRKLF
ncbi:MAG: DUF1015 domain-containing protein [Clostridiales bacterium]|nr:DUF1015 domain-containing protein [Clostridiales bacterium]